jgi:hypothetical protein
MASFKTIVAQLDAKFAAVHPDGSTAANGNTTRKLRDVLKSQFCYENEHAVTITQHYLAHRGVIGKKYVLVKLTSGKTYLDVVLDLLKRHAADGDDEVVSAAPEATSARTEVTDYVKNANASRALDTQQRKNLTSALNKALPTMGYKPNSVVGLKAKQMARAVAEHDEDLQRVIPTEAGADLARLIKALLPIVKDKVEHATGISQITDSIKAVRVSTGP